MKSKLKSTDYSDTGFVTIHKFADFLNGFGPLKSSPIEQLVNVLSSPWFHGFLSSNEAEKLLEKHLPGTFLIRFSKSKAGSFALAYIDSTNPRNFVSKISPLVNFPILKQRSYAYFNNSFLFKNWRIWLQN
jgi:hypothetical protein